jgi:hypothetical protein
MRRIPSQINIWTPQLSVGHTYAMADLLVEIHVPLTPTDVPDGEYPFPWIDTVMEFLFELDGTKGEMYDDGEELGSKYLFFVHGAPKPI